MQFSTLTTLFAASLFTTGTLGFYINYGGSSGGWCVGNGVNEGNYKKCDPCNRTFRAKLRTMAARGRVPEPLPIAAMAPRGCSVLAGELV
ncbi:hypothetical protein Tdes44962_MAKER00963 [Teratosphaeria destructans]|uniref:Uncharacterized protein n=1 Tax=Teratosphaeria destructans TaxID=418781 RepID=A0A9W7VYE1_9PEZI|nr:hypothetical protein Tdes44962_MAKER00963 [Teratosphaeria destructans]